jgi:hypothetical protein
MRIHESCVSAEDVKHECKADDLVAYLQMGFGIMIVRKKKWIGFLDYHCEYLGDDLLISRVKIYGDEEESRRLTDKFKGKILIYSYRDRIG